MRLRFLAVCCLATLWGTTANGATFFGPTAYTSAADTPDGFLVNLCDDCVTVLEDFEDNSIDHGIVIESFKGSVLDPNGPFAGYVDSVDGDDGAIDGLGTAGHSYFSPGNTVTVTFPTAVKSAGLVWTDGDPRTDTTFEAFGPDGAIGMVGPASLADASFFGTTFEDAFFGVQDSGGITSIVVTNVGGLGIEIDHVQYEDCSSCTAVSNPEPASGWLMVAGVLGILGLRRRP